MDYDILLVKNNTSGDTVWTKKIGSLGNDYGKSVRQISDGGYIIVGNTERYNIAGDIYLVKTNSYGDTIWTKYYSDDACSFCTQDGQDVQQTPDGGYIILGYNCAGACACSAMLIKTDSLGNELWRSENICESGRAYSIDMTNDGSYIILGYKLIKIDAIGNVIWTKHYIGDDHHSIHQTKDEGYIYCGKFDNEMLLVKTDENGNTEEGHIVVNIDPMPNKEAVFRAYPNPFLNKINIQCYTNNAKAKILNTKGQMIKYINLTYGINRIDLSDLNSGVYLLQFLSNKFLKTETLIKK
ncbi:hypothetical protein ES705_49643 [subsurface metagenome]